MITEDYMEAKQIIDGMVLEGSSKNCKSNVSPSRAERVGSGMALYIESRAMTMESGTTFCAEEGIANSIKSKSLPKPLPRRGCIVTL